MFISRGKGEPLGRPSRPAAVVMGLTAPGVARPVPGPGRRDVIGVSSARTRPRPTRASSRPTGPPLQEPPPRYRFYVELGEELHVDTVSFRQGTRASLHLRAWSRARILPSIDILPLPHVFDRITSKRRTSQRSRTSPAPHAADGVPMTPPSCRRPRRPALSVRAQAGEFQTHMWRTQKARSAAFGQTKAVPAADKEELRSRYGEAPRTGRPYASWSRKWFSGRMRTT